MKKHILAVMPLVFLAACTKSSDNSAPQSPLVPTSLQFQKPSPGAELTQAQVAEMKATLKSNSMMILPPGDLVFPNKNMSEKERIAQENALRLQDPNSYDLMLEARQNCGIVHPNLKIDATFPTEGSSEQNPFDILQKGDHATFSAASGITNKRGNCPVDIGVSYGAGAEVNEINSEERSGTVSANLGSKLKFVMKNPKYAQLLGARGIIVDGGVSGVAAQREVNGKSQSGLLTYSLSGSYLSLKADIPYNADVKILARGNDKAESSGEMTYTVTMKYPTFSATLIGHIVSNGTNTKQETYLNGRPVSEEDLKKIFGEEVPGQRTNSAMKKALLD